MTRMVLTLPADGQTYQPLHTAPPSTTPDQAAERANEHYTRKPDGGGPHRRGKRRRNRHATGQNSHPTIPHETFKLLTGLEKTGKHNKKREKQSWQVSSFDRTKRKQWTQSSAHWNTTRRAASPSAGVEVHLDGDAVGVQERRDPR